MRSCTSFGVGTLVGLATLHRRASAWYAEHRLFKEAIEHALAAGNAREATKLVEALILPAYEQEQMVQLERWLRLVPAEQLQESPSLLFAMAWMMQARGKITDCPGLLRAAEQLLGSIDSGLLEAGNTEQRLLRVLIADVWSEFHYVTGQIEASLERARSGLALLLPGEEIVESHVLEELALALQANGQEEGALVALQQALRNHSANLSSTARLLLMQACVYLLSGNLHQVEHTARHLLQIAQQAELALSQNWAHWLLGMVSYEWNDLDAAIYHWSVVIAHQLQAHFWVVQEAMCILALAYQAKGLYTQAQESAHRLLEWVQEQNNLGELMVVYAFCGRLALIQGEVEEASHWLELAGEHEVRGPMPFFEISSITRAWLQ
jgi:ATP/maltotriose-dependent transcriptional regulator MalT